MMSIHIDKDEEITAKMFASIMDRSESWGSKLAKKSVEMGNSFPRKKHGNMWFATLEQWEIALKMTGWKMRKTKDRIKNERNQDKKI